MPETCPRRIVGESARTRLRDFRGELDLWTERGPVSFVPRSFQAMGKLRCDGRRGGEEERYIDEVRRLSVGYKLVGLYTDWRVYNHRQQCVGWSLERFFFVGSTDYFTLEGGGGGWRSWLVVVKKNFLRVRDDTMLFLRFNHTNGGQKNEAGFEIWV